ncbi:O-antigen ligase family protein [Vibrio ezurae]|uniref:Putative O-antigen ligase n=1 Tax=Vibrio ezurae NBRC 102218 TaxID=1219080 RepID=U3CH60_9VIBR|nr:O-antigen ligase family protein [Vibrio ezurae]GAD80549.1 putative O-antigen ligase [Vibrio ezurae NBRC 102218]
MINLYLITSFFCFIIPATILAYGKSYSYTIIPFMIIGLISLYWCDKNKFDKKAKIIAFSFSAYFFCTLASLLILKGDYGNLDAPSRALLIIPSFILLLSFKPNKKALSWGLAIGSAIAGSIALYQNFVLDVRPFNQIWRFMVIQSGNIAMSMGLFSTVWACHLIKEKRNPLLIFLAFVCAGMGILASLLSGARGGWVISPFILFMIYLIFNHLIHLKTKVVIVITMLVIGYLSYPMVEDRVERASNDIHKYVSGDASYSSVGVRFEMWKGGAHAFLNNPLFGTGYEQRNQSKLDAIKDGWATKNILRHSRLHNNYIEEASIKGIIGITVLLIFFCGPLYVFIRDYRDNRNIYSYLGIIHIISVMSYCLTQNFINHHSGMLFYIMFTIIFYSYSKHYSEERI